MRIVVLLLAIAALLPAQTPPKAAPKTTRPASAPASASALKPQTAPPPAAAAMAQQAAEALKANHVDEALALYKKVTLAAPRWPQGLWFYGLLSYQKQNFLACANTFQQFMALDPKSANGVAMLGLCEFGLKNYRSSLIHLEQSWSMGLKQGDPVTLMTQYHAAILQTKAENFERALYHCFNMARTEPDSPELVVVAGLAGLRRPIFPEQLLPDDRELVFRMGRAVLTSNERRAEEAGKEFEDIIREFPKTPNVHYMYGAELLPNEPEKGVAEMMKELEINPDHIPALVSIVGEYLRTGDAAKALPLAEHAAKVAPTSFATRASYGRALVETGDLKHGIEELEIAAKLAPDSPQVLFALAAAYAKAGRKEDAARARAEFARLKQLAASSSEQAP
jgi:tetratricopeptide (TPR) repeat protein